MHPTATAHCLLFAVPLAVACSDVEHAGQHDEGEVITDVHLTFAGDGAEPFVAVWSDPEADGSPEITPIILPDGAAAGDHVAATYAVTVAFLNALEDPAEDLTPEIADESDQHQVFFTGSALAGPAASANTDAVVTHAYADEDANGLPVGLDNTFTTTKLGSGELTVTLRHLPPENDAAIKVEGLAEMVAGGGFSAIGGDNDAQVSFDITVE